MLRTAAARVRRQHDAEHPDGRLAPQRGADQSIGTPMRRQTVGSATLRMPRSATLGLPERESGSARTRMSHFLETLEAAALISIALDPSAV